MNCKGYYYKENTYSIGKSSYMSIYGVFFSWKLKKNDHKWNFLLTQLVLYFNAFYNLKYWEDKGKTDGRDLKNIELQDSLCSMKNSMKQVNQPSPLATYIMCSIYIYRKLS